MHHFISSAKANHSSLLTVANGSYYWSILSLELVLYFFCTQKTKVFSLALTCLDAKERILKKNTMR